MRGRRLGMAMLLTVLALPATIEAGLLSKTYEFKEGVTLEVGAETDTGLRLDTVQLTLPSTTGGRFLRTGGLVRAEISISNTIDESRKVGIAIALFDAQGRLVGVASGGTKLLPIKPQRQRTYDLVFDYVNEDAYKATTFQISVEAKP